MPISDAQYGVSFSASTVEDQAELLIKSWIGEYLDYWKPKLASDYQRSMMKIPVNYTTRNRFESVKAEEVPKIVVLSTGLAGEPQRDGANISATWRLGVGIAVAAKTEEDANDLVKVYGAIIRDIFMHHPGILGVALDTRWIDEQYIDIPIDDAIMQFKAANEWFEVTIPIVVQKWMGPKAVPEEDVRGYANTIDIVSGLEA
jgi:hypothetical protein